MPEPIRLELEFLRHEDIAARAEQLLNMFGRTESIPVDMERIAELDLHMDILPIPGLRDHDVESFTTSDLKMICVDEHIFSHVEARCRFSIAHEIGHAVLHRDVFEQHSFGTVAEWKDFYHRVDPEDYGWLEWQAHVFGGCLLVPRRHLRREFEAILPQIQAKIQKARASGIDEKAYLDYALQAAADLLRPKFDVSANVLVKRIEKEELVARIRSS